MAKKKKKDGAPGVKQIARNRKAFHDFEVLDQLEAGIELKGTEVKSLRAAQVSFADSFARVREGEMWLLDLHISPYEHGTWTNHKPTRPRKLLLHKKEILQLKARCERKNLTLVPLEIYFKQGRAKIKIGVCKGRKKADKRQALRKKQDQRAMERRD